MISQHVPGRCYLRNPQWLAGEMVRSLLLYLSLKYTYMLMTDRLALHILQLTKFLHTNLFASGSSSVPNTMIPDGLEEWSIGVFVLSFYLATGLETAFFQKCKSL